MSVTLEKIAQSIGLSRATVSRALKNDRSIHPDTRALVFDAAAKAGYQRPVRKTSARSSKHTTPRILVLLPFHSHIPRNYILQRYLGGFTRAASEFECLLSIEELKEQDSKNNLPNEIKNHSADIVIVANRHDPENLVPIEGLLPMVSIQWDHPGIRADIVSSFNYQGVSEITQYLVNKGHKKIAWVGTDYNPNFFSDRKTGLINGLTIAGLPFDPSLAIDNVSSLEEKGKLGELLKKGVTAIVCVNDRVAEKIGIYAANEGIRIPEDLSVTGYDAGPEMLCNGKKITTYDPNSSELGRMAIRTALQRLKDLGAPRMIYLQEGAFMEGETVLNL